METAQIFSGKQTKFMHLTNSKGKSFVAALALKDDFTVQFVFPAKNKENWPLSNKLRYVEIQTRYPDFYIAGKYHFFII